MCRCDVTPDSSSSTFLASVPRYGSTASSASIVAIHDSNGVSRSPGSGGPGSGKPSWTVEIGHAVVVGVDQPRQHEHAVAAELLDARVPAAQLVAVADRRDVAVADQHGAAGQGGGVGGSEQDVAVNEEVGHVAGTLAAGASVRRWTRPRTAPRSRSGQTSSDRSAASRSLARCGWSASSALASRGLPFHLHPEYPPEGITRAELEARYGPRSQDRIREWFADEGLVYAPPPDVVSNTRLALELGEGAREEGLHRAYHDRVMDAYWAEGDRSLAAAGAGGARARRRDVGRGHRARARRSRVGSAWWTPRPLARRPPARPACPRS